MKTTRTPDYFGYIYAIITLIGGFIGYEKANSTISLVSAIVAAAGISYGVTGPITPLRSKSVFITALVLLIFFGSRFFETGRMMPSGIMASLSLIGTLKYGALVFL